MKLMQYLKDRLLYILVQCIAMLSLLVFLRIVGNSYSSIVFILCIWIFFSLVIFLLSYFKRKKEMDSVLKILHNLDEKYLLAEVITKPKRADDKVYYTILKSCNKSMLEHIAKIKGEKKEYREYIEQWIHEVKTPIAAAKLLCENNKSPITKICLSELDKINHFTEQALFYARSDCVEKDYAISQILLCDVIHASIAENKQLLLQHKVSIDVENSDLSVYTDEKWIVFILNQLIINSVKYKKENLRIKFRVGQEDNVTYLSVSDNGIGILESELSRIFEKSFTGSNGRATNNSTGIGLYLCKKLCTKLGVGIEAMPSLSGTDIRLSFYKNHLLLTSVTIHR